MSRRPLMVWIAFTGCLLMVFGVMGWMTVRLLSMEAEDRNEALLRDRVRTALWRMDAFAGPIVAAEATRPYYEYQSFYDSREAFTKMYALIEQGAVRAPSPLLTDDSPYIRVHFQVRADGSIESPQVPEGNERDVAESRFVSPESLGRRADTLVTLADKLDADRFSQLNSIVEDPNAYSFGVSHETDADELPTITLPKRLEVEASTEELEADARDRILDNVNRELRRQKQWAEPSVVGDQVRSLKMTDAIPGQERVDVTLGAPMMTVREGAMRAAWIGDSLLLVRRVYRPEGDVFQGCWLDWPVLETRLRQEIESLLPGATLRPLRSGEDQDVLYALRSLPVALIPGAAPNAERSGVSGLEASLIAAWFVAVLASIAVGVLLQRVVSLSERRGEFVSIVSHELRTPLTTFRLYTDLLSAPKADQAKRERYLSTLKTEERRLSRLVENVLAYSRIERGRQSAPNVTVKVDELLRRLEPELRERADRCNADLRMPQCEEGAVAFAVESSVEQILINLVDNACKYGCAAAGDAVRIDIRTGARRVGIAVCDKGPGVDARETRRIFEPFRKSSRDSIGTKPGVGLGLALSRRLARGMGGDLVIESAADGACFVLWMQRGD